MRPVLTLVALTALAACAEGMDGPPLPDNGAAPEIAAGTVLPFGEVGRVCGLDEGALGTPVETAAQYTLWDSAAGSVEPRTHYVTGIDGGCAVQFTAAMVLFGDVATHEAMRYRGDNANQPWSAVDTAYEEVKAAFCGAPSGQPCGERADALAARTAFVTAYEAFGAGDRFAEILLYQGQVAAAGLKEI